LDWTEDEEDPPVDFDGERIDALLEETYRLLEYGNFLLEELDNLGLLWFDSLFLSAHTEVPRQMTHSCHSSPCRVR
ncbi:hypothetical protein PENTCL1PPCAC_16781, partial [Pristionchus entomophagus]